MIDLRLGDCLDVLPGLPDNSIDLILTDPPYFKVKDESWDRQWHTPDKFLEWLDSVLAELHRVMKPNGSLYIFASPRMSARMEMLVAGRFAVLNRITWVKKKGRHLGNKKSAQRAYFPSSESIIFAEHRGAESYAKGTAGYAVKCDELRGFVFEPLRRYLADEWARAGLSRADADTACQTAAMASRHYFSELQWSLPTEKNYHAMREYANRDGGQYLRREYEYLRREYEDLRREYEDLRREYEDLRRPFSVTADVPYTDVWDFDTVNAYPGKHVCEKPLPLLRHIVEASSRPGGTVLDAFMGSGATGDAAVSLGRNFIGIEKDPAWHDSARERIDRAARNVAKVHFIGTGRKPQPPEMTPKPAPGQFRLFG